MTLPPRRVGLTGSIGAGKSTVAQLLRARGLTVLDADEQARLVTAEPQTLRLIEARFPGVVRRAPHGAVLDDPELDDPVLDRPALSARVFGDSAALADLNAIVHPRVRARMSALEAQASGTVVQDVPLLFEGGLAAGLDAVIVVDAPLELRVARVMARSGLSREEVLARDARQLPAAEKRARATVVIENSGNLETLEAQVDAALNTLKLSQDS